MELIDYYINKIQALVMEFISFQIFSEKFESTEYIYTFTHCVILNFCIAIHYILLDFSYIKKLAVKIDTMHDLFKNQLIQFCLDNFMDVRTWQFI